MDEVAEWLAQQQFFVDVDGLVVDLRGREAEMGFAVVLGQPRHDLGTRCHRLADPSLGQRIVGAGVGLLEGIGPEPDGIGELPLEFISMIKHVGADCTLARLLVTSIVQRTNYMKSMTYSNRPTAVAIASALASWVKWVTKRPLRSSR